MISYGAIIRLVWPLALSMVNSSVMQFADRAYLANHSMAALEAALPAGMLMWVIAGFFQGIVGYSSVFVGQYSGAGDEAHCRASYRLALMLAAISSLLSLPLICAGRLVIALTSSDPTLTSAENSYFTILMAGSAAIYFQMAAAAYFTGRGDTRIVFWTNLIGNVINLILDPLLIFGWRFFPTLGIAGAAYATVISMSVQALILVLKTRGGVSAKVDFAFLKRFLRVALPSAFYAVSNMLSFTIFVFVTEGVGSLELAVSNACFSLNYLLFAPMEGFAMGASTLVAQELGRGQPARAALAARRTMILGVAFAAIVSTLALAFAHPILDLFASGAGERAGDFHALGLTLLALMAAWLLFDAADIILTGALKGAGDTRFVMGWMLLTTFCLWLPAVFIVRRFSNTMPALWTTMIGCVVVLFLGSYLRWRRGKWRSIKLV